MTVVASPVVSPVKEGDKFVIRHDILELSRGGGLPMKKASLVLGFLIVGMVANISEAGRRSSGYKAPSPYTTGNGSNYNPKSNSGYVKKSGTYVEPHFKSGPNKTQLDNWSTKGNENRHQTSL